MTSRILTKISFSFIGVLAISLLLSTIIHAQDQKWRSELYPFDWEKGFSKNGKFLHDFSYAGYHRGEQDIPDRNKNVLDVTLPPFNADNSGAEDATTAIQAAIDSVNNLNSGIVYLPAGTYLVKPGDDDTVLKISGDSTIIRGAGADQTFILNTATNMRKKNIIEFSPGSHSWYSRDGSAIDLTQDAVEQDSIIYLADASHFEVGDKIVLTTDFTLDFIAEHQMMDKWKTTMDGVAFARTVKAIDVSENTILLDIPIRYYLKTRDNAQAYRIRKQIAECGLEDLSIGNLENPNSGLGDNDYNTFGTAAYEVHASYAIEFKNAENCWMRNVNTYKPTDNSGDYHLLSNGLQIYQSRLMTIDSCHFQKPQYEGGGGNGYMFTLKSNDCLISNSVAEHSRHNFDFKKPYCSGNVIYKCTSKNARYASDFHMHLSMSNLFDNHTVDGDFLEAIYRPYGSVEHGHTTTQSVFWNTIGESYHPNQSVVVKSGQWGYGYVIGTQGNATGVSLPTDNNSIPKDHLEGEGTGALLRPVSLYQDQLNRRLKGLGSVDSTGWDAPEISIVSPVSYEHIGNSVQIEVDIQGIAEIAKVVYLAGDQQIAEVTSSPFTATWEGMEDDCYDLSAYAVSKSGSVSNTATIKVIAGKGCEKSFFRDPIKFPGKLEAEYFNRGINTLSYYDTDKVNNGNTYRNEWVDIEPCSEGGYNISWIEDGEYLRYIIEIKEADTYNLLFRVASNATGQIEYDFIDQQVTGTASISTTGGWQEWETVTVEQVELKQGIDTLQLNFSGSLNLNYVEAEIMPEEVISGLEDRSNALSVYPNPTDGSCYITSEKAIMAYRIYDLTGKLMLENSSPINNSEVLVDMHHLSDGIYRVSVQYENGIISKPILKK